ncbi:hypothetical protein RINTHM_8650 [Richelia intracellularis HM01]|nr:hypothetical protein RINTHM_8650 [Richelia intracellularis HM01]
MIGNSFGVDLTHDFMFDLFAHYHHPEFCEKNFVNPRQGFKE